MSDVTDLIERFRAFAHQWLKGSLRDDDIYTFTDATGEHTIRASDLLSAADALERLNRPSDDVVEALRERTDPEWHRIDAYRVIKAQVAKDASHAALARALAQFVADEFRAAIDEARAKAIRGAA